MNPPTPNTDKLFEAHYRIAKEGEDRCEDCGHAPVPAPGIVSHNGRWCQRIGVYVTNEHTCDYVSAKGAKS